MKRAQRERRSGLSFGVAQALLWTTTMGGCVAPSLNSPSVMPTNSVSIPRTDSADSPPLVTMALEPSIDFGEVTAIYVTETFPSPFPPISGWGWLMPAKAAPLQVKVPWPSMAPGVRFSH